LPSGRAQRRRHPVYGRESPLAMHCRHGPRRRGSARNQQSRKPRRMRRQRQGPCVGLRTAGPQVSDRCWPGVWWHSATPLGRRFAPAERPDARRAVPPGRCSLDRGVRHPSGGVSSGPSARCTRRRNANRSRCTPDAGAHARRDPQEVMCEQSHGVDVQRRERDLRTQRQASITPRTSRCTPSGTARAPTGPTPRTRTRRSRSKGSLRSEACPRRELESGKEKIRFGQLKSYSS